MFDFIRISVKVGDVEVNSVCLTKLKTGPDLPVNFSHHAASVADRGFGRASRLAVVGDQAGD